MSYINSLPDGGSSGKLQGSPEPQGQKGVQGPKGDPGTGFKLAPDGNFDMDLNKFLKKDVDGNYFDLKGSNIRNGEPYYDGLFGDRDHVTKEYVDIQDDKREYRD